MLWLLSNVDPLYASVIGLAIGIYWLWKSTLSQSSDPVSDPKYEEPKMRSQTALDSLRMWAEKHHIEHHTDKLQVDFRRKCSKKGHPVFNLGMITVLDDVLKELLARMNVEYTPEDLQTMMFRNLPPFLDIPKRKILEETLVVDLNQKTPDFSTEVFGIFRHFLVQAVTDYMEDQIKNVHSNSRKKLTRCVNELAKLMVQHEVFIDHIARDAWVSNGTGNRQDQEQVYQTPEEREGLYQNMRKALNKMLTEILQDLRKILTHMQQAHKNGRPVTYYCLPEQAGTEFTIPVSNSTVEIDWNDLGFN